MDCCEIMQINCSLLYDSLVAQAVKNLPAKQDTPVQPLGREDPLEKGKKESESLVVSDSL